MTLREMRKEAVLVGRRWLRDLLFADWGLKLLALIIALGLWFAVAGQRAPATVRLRKVPLSFVLPPDMEISNEPREEVDVTLRGSKRALELLRSGDLAVSYDASAFRPGERLVHLSPLNLNLELPDAVAGEAIRIERVEPSAVPLRLEHRIERELEVEPRFEGELPGGYELYGVHVVPQRIRVRGPESHVNALRKAATEPIPLAGRAETFTAKQVAIDIDDARVVPLETVVDVVVSVGEARAERRFEGVVVRPPEGAVRPDAAAVVLRGPRSLVEKLRTEDLALVLESTQNGAPRARLQLPPSLEGRFELLSTTPAEF